MSLRQLCELDLILEEQLQNLATTLKSGTVAYYRVQVNRFARYLHQSYPEIQTPAQLQRNPHILGWLRSLAVNDHPLTNRSRRAALICMRRLFDDLIDNGYPIREALILGQDIPPRDHYLPIPLSPEVDSLLDQQLSQTDDLLANALLLIRATGMRVGECLRLNRGSLRHLAARQYALHVPLGKLHNERWVPMDDEACTIFNRILSLTSTASPDPANPSSHLLILPNGKKVTYCTISAALKKAAKRTGTPPVRLHQLRHTYATVMLRAGISLPALKEILGHRDIRMTMGYVQVTQNDLQREYASARQKIASLHAVPILSNTKQEAQVNSPIQDLCKNIDAITHQLEMYRRQLSSKHEINKAKTLARRLDRLRKALTSFRKT